MLSILFAFDQHMQVFGTNFFHFQIEVNLMMLARTCAYEIYGRLLFILSQFDDMIVLSYELYGYFLG